LRSNELQLNATKNKLVTNRNGQIKCIPDYDKIYDILKQVHENCKHATVKVVHHIIMEKYIRFPRWVCKLYQDICQECLSKNETTINSSLLNTNTQEYVFQANVIDPSNNQLGSPQEKSSLNIDMNIDSDVSMDMTAYNMSQINDHVINLTDVSSISSTQTQQTKPTVNELDLLTSVAVNSIDNKTDKEHKETKETKEMKELHNIHQKIVQLCIEHNLSTTYLSLLAGWNTISSKRTKNYNYNTHIMQQWLLDFSNELSLQRKTLLIKNKDEFLSYDSTNIPKFEQQLMDKINKMKQNTPSLAHKLGFKDASYMDQWLDGNKKLSTRRLLELLDVTKDSNKFTTVSNSSVQISPMLTVSQIQSPVQAPSQSVKQLPQTLLPIKQLHPQHKLHASGNNESIHVSKHFYIQYPLRPPSPQTQQELNNAMSKVQSEVHNIYKPKLSKDNTVDDNKKIEAEARVVLLDKLTDEITKHELRLLKNVPNIETKFIELRRRMYDHLWGNIVTTMNRNIQLMRMCTAYTSVEKLLVLFHDIEGYNYYTFKQFVTNFTRWINIHDSIDMFEKIVLEYIISKSLHNKWYARESDIMNKYIQQNVEDNTKSNNPKAEVQTEDVVSSTTTNENQNKKQKIDLTII
jgi:hypothetical protein